MQATRTQRRLRSLGLTLSLASFVWGVAVGSYFGAPAPFDWLQQLKVIDINDFDYMMRLSIGIGALHLLLANLMMAWVRRQSLQAWASVGWALAVLSALLGWLQGFHLLHWLVFALGLIMVLGMSGQEERWQVRGLLQGTLALTNITKFSVMC